MDSDDGTTPGSYVEDVFVRDMRYLDDRITADGSSGWPVVAVSALLAGYNNHSGADIGISPTPPPVRPEDVGTEGDEPRIPGGIPAGSGRPPMLPTVLATFLLLLLVAVPLRRAAQSLASRLRA